MSIKSVSVGKYTANYKIEDEEERIYVESVVKDGNWVERYNGRLSFDTLDDLIKWLENK